MSTAEWERLERNLARIGQMAALLKLVIGAGVAVVGSIIAVVFWVNAQTTLLADTQRGLVRIEADRSETLKEWNEWRRLKDENDTRQMTLIENQQRILERQQALLDRLR